MTSSKTHDQTIRAAARRRAVALVGCLRSLHPAHRAGRGTESGAIAVEFALVLPLVLIMFMLILDVGKGINYWVTETHLASEGARFAAVGQTPNGSDIRDYIREQAGDELEAGGTNAVPSPLEVCIDFPDGGTEVGDDVKVELRSSYQWMPFLGLGVSQTAINASATHRLEKAPTYSAGCS